MLLSFVSRVPALVTDYCEIEIEREMSKKKVILLDGGIGQELVRRYGKPATKYWATTTLIEEPKILTQLHAEYFEVGATYVL